MHAMNGLWGTALIVCFAAAAQARADELSDCNAALVKGQELARAGSLQAARTQYPTCMRAACDPQIRTVCASFLAEISARIPSIRIEVHAADGQEVAGAVVTLDEVAVADRTALLDVDPGDHVLHVEAPGYAPADQRVTVTEREHGRQVSVVVSRPGPPPAVATPVTSPPPLAEARSGIPTSTYVLGAVSVVTVGSFVTFGLLGNTTQSQLRNTCPTGPCNSTTMRTEYAVADASLAVGIISAGLAVWFALHHDAPSSAMSFSVGAGNGAASVSLGGSF